MVSGAPFATRKQSSNSTMIMKATYQTAANAPLTGRETDHAAGIVIRLRDDEGYSVPELSYVLGYASSSMLYNLINHSRPISREKYTLLCEWGSERVPPQERTPAARSADRNRTLDPTKISTEETAAGRVMVADLRKREWTMEDIRERLGYANPSPLYALAAGDAGIARDKFEALKQLHSSEELSPARQREEQEREAYRAQVRTEVAAELEEAHRREVETVRAELSAARATQAAAVAQAPAGAPGTDPKEGRLVHRSPGAVRPTSALEAFPQYTETLASLSRRMEEHAKTLATPLTAHGWQHYVQKVRSLAEEIQRAVG